MSNNVNVNMERFIESAYRNFDAAYNANFRAGSAVCGANYGDEGKGKIVDSIIRKYKANGYKVINYRGQGGGNAGHTVVDSDSGKEYHFHYLPSGGLESDIILLGAGMLLDPVRIHEEASVLPKEQRAKILVDERATLSTLLERSMDGYYEGLRSKNGIQTIGTTGSGVGTTVAERAIRNHITFADAVYAGSAEELYKLFEGIYSVPEEIFNSCFSMDYCRQLWEAIKSIRLVNSSVILQKCNSEGWAGVLEISQAFGLDCIHGNEGHYVTSTHTTIPGALADVGLSQNDIPDGGVLVSKAYASKVGSGKFMTEFQAHEKLIDEFIHQANGEYGVSTGRRRSCGWYDCPLTAEAIRKNGSKVLAITCVDTIGRIPSLVAKICVAYKRIQSADIKSGKSSGKRSAKSSDAKNGITYWPYFQVDYSPVYKAVPVGWDVRHVKDQSKIPDKAWAYLANIEFYTGGYVKYIGTGGGSRDLVEVDAEGRQKINQIKSKIYCE